MEIDEVLTPKMTLAGVMNEQLQDYFTRKNVYLYRELTSNIQYSIDSMVRKIDNTIKKASSIKSKWDKDDELLLAQNTQNIEKLLLLTQGEEKAKEYLTETHKILE